MRVLVCVEHRFDRSPDGAVWTQIAYEYEYWLRYLEVFDSVRIVARVRDVDEIPVGHVRVDGDRVTVAAVPHYLGPWQFVRNRNRVIRAIKSAMLPGDAVILRVVSQIANCLFPSLRSNGRPFGVEVVGDPWDVFAPGAVSHPLRAFFRYYFWRQLRAQCAHACAASYVTEAALQRRYPANERVMTISASTVNLRSEALRPPRWNSDGIGLSAVEADSRRSALKVPQSVQTIRLLFVGSLAQLYKGLDILLKAMVECIAKGLHFTLTVVGDGKHREQFERLAVELGIADAVIFRGQVAAGQAIRDELDKADLFVLPSLTEGLPRALLEAMARSLPCIATTVGGIPEILAKEDLVPPGDINSLAEKIMEVAGNEGRQRQMAERNYKRALDFHDDVLAKRRRGFYEAIRESTSDWLSLKDAA